MKNEKIFSRHLHPARLLLVVSIAVCFSCNSKQPATAEIASAVSSHDDDEMIAVASGEELLRRIQHANPGEVIHLGPQRYHVSQSIVVRRPIVLVGSGMFDTVVTTEDVSVAIDITDAASGTRIEGIAFENTCSDETQRSAECQRGVSIRSKNRQPGIVAESPHLEVSHCRFLGYGAAIALMGNNAYIHHNLIVDSSSRGVFLEAFSGSINNNTIVNTGRPAQDARPDWGIQGTITDEARITNNLIYNDNHRSLNNAIYVSSVSTAILPSAFSGNRAYHADPSGFGRTFRLRAQNVEQTVPADNLQVTALSLGQGDRYWTLDRSVMRAGYQGFHDIDPTLQGSSALHDAMVKANPGDRVIIKPGTLTLQKTLVVDRRVLVIGENGMFETVIDASSVGANAEGQSIAVDIASSGHGSKIDGISFIGPSAETAPSVGIRSHFGAEGVEIANNRIVGFKNAVALRGGNASVHHNLIVRSSLRGVSLGDLRFAGEVYNNTIVDSGTVVSANAIASSGWAIQGAVASNAKIVNNLIYNHSDRLLTNAIYLTHRQDPNRPSGGIPSEHFRGNVVHAKRSDGGSAISRSVFRVNPASSRPPDLIKDNTVLDVLRLSEAEGYIPWRAGLSSVGYFQPLWSPVEDLDVQSQTLRPNFDHGQIRIELKNGNKIFFGKFRFALRCISDEPLCDALELLDALLETTANEKNTAVVRDGDDQVVVLPPFDTVLFSADAIREYSIAYSNLAGADFVMYQEGALAPCGSPEAPCALEAICTPKRCMPEDCGQSIDDHCDGIIECQSCEDNPDDPNNPNEPTCSGCEAEFCLDGNCVTPGSPCPCPEGLQCGPKQQCQPPELLATCGDGDKNGTETGDDCGGVCGTCVEGQTCNGPSDCLSQNCQSGHCAPGTQPITVAALRASAQWQQIDRLLVDLFSAALADRSELNISDFSDVLKLSADDRKSVLEAMQQASGAIVNARSQTPSLSYHGDESPPIMLYGRLKRSENATPEYLDYAAFQTEITKALKETPDTANRFSATVFARIGTSTALRFEPGDMVIASYTPSSNEPLECQIIPQGVGPVHPARVLSNVTCLYNNHKHGEFRNVIEDYLKSIVGPKQSITAYQFGCPKQGDSLRFACSSVDEDYLLTLTPLNPLYASAFSFFDLRGSDLEKFRQGRRQTAKSLSSLLVGSQHPLANQDISSILLHVRGESIPQTYSFAAILDALSGFANATADDVGAMEGLLQALGINVIWVNAITAAKLEKYYNAFHKKDFGLVPYTKQVRIWYGAGGLEESRFDEFDTHAFLLHHNVKRTFPDYNVEHNTMLQRFGTKNLPSLIEWMEDPSIQSLYFSAHGNVSDDLLYADSWSFDPTSEFFDVNSQTIDTDTGFFVPTHVTAPWFQCVLRWNEYKELYSSYADTRAIRFSYHPQTAQELASCSITVLLHWLKQTHQKAFLFGDVPFGESVMGVVEDVGHVVGAASGRGPTTLSNDYDLEFFPTLLNDPNAFSQLNERGAGKYYRLWNALRHSVPNFGQESQSFAQDRQIAWQTGVLARWRDIAATSIGTRLEAFPKVVSIDGQGTSFTIRISSPVRKKGIRLYEYHHGDPSLPSDISVHETLVSVPAYCATRNFSLSNTGVRWEGKVEIDGDSFASHLVVGGTRGLIRNRHSVPSLNTTCDVQNDVDAQEEFEKTLNLSIPSIRIFIPSSLEAPNGIRLHGNNGSYDWEWESETVTTVISVADSLTKQCRRPTWKEWAPEGHRFTVKIPCKETDPVRMLVTESEEIEPLCPDQNICDAVIAAVELQAKKSLKKICDNTHRGLSDSSDPPANTFHPMHDQASITRGKYQINATMDCRLPGNNP